MGSCFIISFKNDGCLELDYSEYKLKDNLEIICYYKRIMLYTWSMVRRASHKRGLARFQDEQARSILAGRRWRLMKSLTTFLIEMMLIRCFQLLPVNSII